jgi:hypothetical protein
MFPFILYLASGLITAVHVYVLLTLTAIGAPHSALEFLSLLGSFGLCLSSYLSLFRPQLGAKLALPSAIVSWSFYGPAILQTLSAGRQHQITDPRIAALPYIAVSLLALATVYSAIVSFRKTNEGKLGDWIFPERAGRSTRTIVGALSLTLAIALAAGFSFSHQTSVRRASTFLIPAEYVGWVRVEFQVPGTAPLPVEGGQYRFEIAPDGLLKTSSAEQFGSSKDEYYYTSGGKLRSLPSTGRGQMIWGRMNGEEAGPAAIPRNYEQFFVGSEEEFRKQAGVPARSTSQASSK